MRTSIPIGACCPQPVGKALLAKRKPSERLGFGRASPVARHAVEAALARARAGQAIEVDEVILSRAISLGIDDGSTIVDNHLVAPNNNVERVSMNVNLSKHQRALKATLVGTLIYLVLDSGCTWHCHPHQSDLINFRYKKEIITGISGGECEVVGIGDLPMIGKDDQGKLHKFLLTNVRVVPSFTDTLVSIEQLWSESRTDIRFCDIRKIFIPESDHGPPIQLPFDRIDGLYQMGVAAVNRLKGDATSRSIGRSLAASPSKELPTYELPQDRSRDQDHASKAEQTHGAKSTSHLAALSSDAVIDALHRRLHVSQDLLRKLPDRTADAPANLKSGRTHSCDACTEANATRLPHKSDRYEPSYVGRLVHADIVGPFKRSLVGSFQYMLVLVDDHSRFISVHFLTSKDEALTQVKKFVASLNAMVNAKRSTPIQIVGTLQTDNAGEFLSRAFTEFLDSEHITQTTCPPHVHSLNGVAERAIRAVVENMRSTITAGNIPISFWNYVAAHSADVLNRTGIPPQGDKTAYELVMGEQPKVLGIWPMGCRAFPVKPRSAISKTHIDNHAWRGINLGSSDVTPNAYYVWIPALHRVALTSDVWMDETLMPWRPAGDQRVGAPPPHHAHHVDQPPGLQPAIVSPTSTTPPTASTLGQAFDHATKGSQATARMSTTVLLLFSGPKRRPDGLAVFLHRLGYTTVMVDNDPGDGAGTRDDMLNDDVYNDLLNRARGGEFLAIIAAPPCNTFSIARFITPKDGKPGPTPLRTRESINGMPDLSDSNQRKLRDANVLIRRMCAILLAGHMAGTQFMIENPSDRGDPTESDIFLHENHGPVWLMPAIIALLRVTGSKQATFPMCAFSSPWQKFTTIAYSAGFEAWAAPLNKMRCHHSRHEADAGGELSSTGWNSSAAAAYPPNFNLYLAKCVGGLSDAQLLPPPSPAPEAEGGRGSSSSARPSKASETTDAAPTPISIKPTARTTAPAASPSPMRSIDFESIDPSDAPAPPIAEIPKRTKKTPFVRDLGRPVTRGSQPPAQPLLGVGMALLCLGGPWRLNTPTSLAMLAKPDTAVDPANRKAAMQSDCAGWTKSEQEELDNHRNNESFERIDRSTFERTGRKLVKTVWVYKVKRSGKLKSRLCVQGCSQIPGVDYDQTHCSSMRAPTLRLLSSLAAKLDLKMRRWDFVAAYLQGELLEGEVVYCHAPPGHPSTGSDGREQVLKVIKPIYGMAQAGRRWQRTLYPWMEEWCAKSDHFADASFTRLFADSNVFTCKRTVNTPTGKREEHLIIGVYVDDCFILYSHDDEYSLYHRFTADLASRWKVDDEGPVSDLLGVEISSEDGIVELKQTAYIEKMTATWYPDGVPSTFQSNQTPTSPLLAQNVADALVDISVRDPASIKRFQSLVGALLYASTNTRPDIAYSVGMLCRVMAKPTPELQQDAMRVLAYLYRTRDIGLRYKSDGKAVKGMSDSDWGVKHSTSGFLFLYNMAAISWGSKKQQSVALSSCEAEIMAASVAASEAVHLKGFIEELDQSDGKPISLGVDNTAARDIAYNPEHHAKVKHIQRRHFFVRECVENMQITVPYVNTCDNLADFFTKSQDPKLFFRMRDEIMNVSPALKHNAAHASAKHGGVLRSGPSETRPGRSPEPTESRPGHSPEPTSTPTSTLTCR